MAAAALLVTLRNARGCTLTEGKIGANWTAARPAAIVKLRYQSCGVVGAVSGRLIDTSPA